MPHLTIEITISEELREAIERLIDVIEDINFEEENNDDEDEDETTS